MFLLFSGAEICLEYVVLWLLGCPKWLLVVVFIELFSMARGLWPRAYRPRLLGCCNWLLWCGYEDFRPLLIGCLINKSS